MPVREEGYFYLYRVTGSSLKIMSAISMKMLSDYNSAVEYIRSLAVRGSVLGLERVRLLCDKLGNVQNAVPCIHVAGTNGKGSTCAMLSSILSKSGYRVGMYTSPSLTDELDHYRINGELISKDDYTRYVNQIAEIMDEYDIEATQFEVETALAFLAFSSSKCDIEIIECGLGGRDDATNIIDEPLLCVMTSVSLDHAAILGDTVEKIAAVKAGIVQKGSSLVTFTYNSGVDDVIENKAKKCGSRVYKVNPDDISVNSQGFISYNGIYDAKLSLEGTCQKENAALVIKCTEALRDKGLSISDEAVISGLANTYWPFRFEKICDNPIIILDGAHNPDAADKLASTIESQFPGYRKIFVAAVFADKDYERIMASVCPLADAVMVTKTKDNTRALDTRLLADTIMPYCSDTSVFDSNYDAAKAALSRSDEYLANRENHMILCFGSLSYLASIKAEFEKLLMNRI